MASLSDTPRRLGSESGRLRRIARQVERGGGNPQELLMAAAKSKLGERGITSAESNEAEQRLGERMQRGLLETQRRSLLDGVRPNVDESPLPRSATPPSLIPGSPQPRTAGEPAVATPSALVGTSPIAAPAPRRGGLIDGKPAGDVLSGMRDRQSTGQPFGKSIATANLETKGLDGAVADYQRRAEAQDAPGRQAPGNMDGVVGGLGIPGVSDYANLKTRKATPLQDALDAARARRVAAEPMIPDAAPVPEQAPMTMGGVPVRNDTYGVPRRESAPRSAVTPSLIPAPAASIAPVAPARPIATFQPADASQSESALLNRRKQAEMAAAREKMGRDATAPNSLRGTAAGGLLKFLSKPRL